jgi:hypothetical protein
MKQLEVCGSSISGWYRQIGCSEVIGSSLGASKTP